VRALADRVAERATEQGALYRTIGIKVVTPPFDIQTRERSLSGPVDDPDLLEREALDLLAEFDEAPVRKLGVRVSNLEFAERDQGTLGGWDEASTGEEPAGDQGEDRGGDADETAADANVATPGSTDGQVPDRTRNVPDDPEQLTLAAYARD
jgi:DNA polymerase IV (DinB-like DNA polymerase)